MEEIYQFLPLHERQIALEKRMRGIGFERVEKSTTAARTDGRESETSYGHKLLLSVVEPLSERITAYLAEAFSGKAGRHQRAAVKMKALNPDAVAYLTAKTVLDALSINKMEQQVAEEVGRAIEEEARFQSYHSQLPALFDTIMRDHKKKRKAKRYTKRVMKLRIAKAGGTWEEWTKQDCLLLGLKLIDLFLRDERAIVVRSAMQVRKKRKFAASYRLVLGPGVEDLIQDVNNLTALLTPGLLPTVVPPKRWNSPFGGAYWTGAIDRKAKRLVKTRNMNYMEDLRHTDMPRVYEAVNAVQDTAWQINKRVLDVVHEAWEIGREIRSLPSQRKMEAPTMPATKPPCKYSEDKDQYRAWIATPAGQAWKSWRRITASVHEFNHKNKSRLLQAAKVMWVAGMFEQDEAIYFPHQLDFRSRLYAMPMFLHPQGPDYVRGLLRFSEGKPITTPAAKNWLAIHGANSYGIDKVSFHERCDWVRTNEQRILDSAIDPMGTVDWWSEAENPWQFLAFCFEWQHMGLCAAANIPFISHLPVSLDGTCNGLQHFSAMLRDPVGGAATNLTLSDKPQDIYAEVAKKVNLALVADGSEMAQRWLAFGVDRKLCKRPVMILPYGGTQYACRRYVSDFVIGYMMDDAGNITGSPQHIGENPFGEELPQAVIYLSKIIWTAIGETVVAAKDAMHWLRATARLMAKAQLAVVWQTPAGFPVRQAYPEMRNARVEFLIDGKRTYRLVKEETDGLDKEKQINGLSPNFVHSLDAAALMETTVQCRRLGIRSFAMVHDSYGTHAADTEALAHTLKEAFVALYQQHDVLAELSAAVVEALPADAVVPEIPASGSLSIDAVLESKFFFA